ncbi:ubiquitin carboxyl-terminal hydrolase 8-like isoform X2 [Magnolia sinica]|uniref:ubiquitin carboxyl-terminal hydrolase 8-like isoform X2 n=1 Tax=Magnolia sinica TaxID=86752 RepID=UPI00265B3A7B|nr:ubiquitin carboxyl-terminal hydrolase 8-like isoform X2 [Magnolia sinica]
MDGSTPTESPNFPPRPIAEGEQVYFVPYRWLKEEDVEREKGVLYTATSSSSSYVVGPIKIINNIFNSDLVFNLRREGEDAEWIEKSEEGVSGRDFALVLEEVWLQTLKWHSNSNVATRNGGSSSVAEDGMADVYPLQLRLSVMREANQLSLRISKRDNAVEFYKRACKIFSAESEPIRIWDFSGQTNLYFVGERNNISKDCQRQSDQEILLELQVYGLSDSVKCRTEGSKMTMSSCSGSHMNNGSTGTVLTNCTALSGNFGMGLIGLQNLGNTCFMNSAIQCLVHTDMLVEYFLGDYSREINQQNPLGMGGELALAFGELLRKLWAPGRAPVAPRSFKTTLGCFAPQFSGFNQHDSQELLAFLLDGLHEDLNRVKHKPYLEAKDAHGRSDEEVADEYWENHLARNDSIIVDVCQVYSNRIIRYLEEPSDSISLIRDDDRLAAYRLSNNLEKLPLVVFMHQRMEEHYISGKMTSSWKAFGIPLVTRLGNITNGSDIHKLFLNLLNPFQRPGEASLDDQDNSMNSAAVEGIVMDDATSPHISGGENSTEEPMDKSHFENKVEFFLTDEKGITKDYKVEMNEPFTIKGSCRRLHVLVCWQDKTIKQYDIPPLISLPEIFKSGYPKKPQELISLYACLEAFLREEPLGPEDMWYCPCCKMHRQASKKLDLWRLPEILVIHLKRFSYSRFMKNKLEAFVDFPIRDLDLSNYIPCKNGQSLNCYELYALSNHYGGMGGGHYTAYVNHKRGNQWHEFDDSNVFPITVDKIKTSAAYVLFYRRVGASDPST